MRRKHTVDARPFRSCSERRREETLVARYGRIAIPEVAAILRQMKVRQD